MERYQQFAFIVFLNFFISSRVLNGAMQEQFPRQKRHSDPLQEDTPPVAGIPSQNSILTTYYLGQCLLCPPGPPGAVGPPGVQGPPGRDGRDAVLFAGSVDHGGETQPPAPITPDGNVSFGAVYTRWGRITCPDEAELIYQGIMAGSHYSHPGGAADYLCLSKEPIFDNPQAGYQYQTYVYGTEYETGSSVLLQNLQDLEVPCAVCLAPSKTIALMVPGRNQCPQSQTRRWKLEYQGYIMSQHSSQPRTQHVCVDHEAEGISRTHGNHDGALLYHVESTCATGGGIPCPPYAEGFELTCAVCSL
ncbi:hypothetical protein HOLleu_06549 [Holothuria leucospilota]|uniref:Uncharacterized protein n=1 Tax=Holothuria leucospilota TaxID=206669 RepID=A0A9Q1CLN7_HOLLE|nr:hypothetical protein HOLleu_06549 [Holothuria leucospilota]